MYDDAHDALAAEYVLGTLSADERQHAEALMEIDPGFADAVRQWERRLGELNVMVEAVEPPPEIWEKIRAEIGGVTPPDEIPLSTIADGAIEPTVETVLQPEASPPAEEPPLGDEFLLTEPESADETPAPVAAEPGAEAVEEKAEDETGPGEHLTGEAAEEPADLFAAALAKSLAESAPEPQPPEPPASRADVERSAEIVRLSRRVGRWRGMTVLMGAIAAALALYIGLAKFAPGLIPFGPLAGTQVAQSQQPAQLGTRLVAVLQQEPTAPAFLLTVDPQRRTMVVRRVSAAPEPGRSYELWIIPKQSPTPRSLGLVGADEYTQRALPGNVDVETLRSARYAVSLEPSGGSPSGVPTGPVLFTGNIVQSVPTPAPAGPAKT